MISKVFGTGGIGSGIFFNLEGNHTLGRDESRLGYLTDYKDYCKQHIILHYIAKLSTTDVYAIGMVGEDTQGKELLQKMSEAGIKTDYVGTTKEARTMQAVCFQYPDGSGGNITTSNSACEMVSTSYVEQCAQRIDNCSLVLSVPEVPLDSRIRLLQIGREKGAFTVGSFLSAEAKRFEEIGGFLLCDLISVNLDEAKAVAKIEGTPAEIAEKAAEIIATSFLIVTAGKDGAFVFENGKMAKVKIIDVPIVSTAGAGDALIGGTIAGLIKGKGLLESVRIGTAVSAFAVGSADTIAEEVNLENINQFIKKRGLGNGL